MDEKEKLGLEHRQVTAYYAECKTCGKVASRLAFTAKEFWENESAGWSMVAVRANQGDPKTIVLCIDCVVVMVRQSEVWRPGIQNQITGEVNDGEVGGPK